MLLFKRRDAEPPVENLWGPQFNERRVPEGPDESELDRLVLRLQAMIEMRAPYSAMDQANEIVASIEAEIAAALQSPTKHRDWRETRPRILGLLTELGQVVYQELPPTDDE
jgi:hypothetical protein